jgi:hypothetical protein
VAVHGAESVRTAVLPLSVSFPRQCSRVCCVLLASAEQWHGRWHGGSHAVDVVWVEACAFGALWVSPVAFVVCAW